MQRYCFSFALQLQLATAVQGLCNDPVNTMQVPGNFLCEVDGITFEHLRQSVEAVRGRTLPSRTLYYWLNKLAIERDAEGFYSSEDIEVLTALVQWLALPHTTIATFIIRLQKWRNSHAHQ